MKNWFPLPRSLMEDEDFTVLSPSEKLYLWLVMSRWAKDGQFYKADLEFAGAVGVSVRKIRQARKRCEHLGYVRTQPGYRAAGRHLATTYLEVPCLDMAEGDFFAQVHRFTFDALLYQVRDFHYSLTREHLVVYVTLSYLQWKFRGSDNGKGFYISKADLRALSGIFGAERLVGEIHQAHTFNDGAHLFEYEDTYHKLVFSAWCQFADPSENESNANNARHYQRDLELRIADLRDQSL